MDLTRFDGAAAAAADSNEFGAVAEAAIARFGDFFVDTFWGL